jgi:putative PIN family toxin of toxin-antitoxin system
LGRPIVRAVVDTNVWVSALLNRSGTPAIVPAALEARRFTLITSEPLPAELAEVLLRPRVARKHWVTADDAGELVALLRRRAVIAPVAGGLAAEPASVAGRLDQDIRARADPTRLFGMPVSVLISETRNLPAAEAYIDG